MFPGNVGELHRKHKKQSGVLAVVIQLESFQTAARKENAGFSADFLLFLSSDHVFSLLHQVSDVV